MDTQQNPVTSARTNPYAPPRASVRDIVTASAPADPAERGTRLGANVLDTLIFGVMVVMPMLVAAMFDPQQAALIMGLMLIGFIAWCWLTILYMKRNGQSIGKKLTGIKVVRSDGSPVSLGRLVFLRNVVNMMFGMFPFYGLIDALFIFGESRQCLHDKIADTIVVVA